VPIQFLDGEKWAEETIRVLTNSQLWLELHERSQGAHQKYFSREAVASRFIEVLHRA